MADQIQTNANLKSGNRIQKPIIGFGCAFLLIFSIFTFQVMTTESSQARMGQYDHGVSESSQDGQVQKAHWRKNGKSERWGHRGGFFGRSSDDIEERVTKMVKHMSVEIDATPEQEQQIIDIVVPAAVNVASMRDNFKDARDEFEELITADTIDKDALEKLRSDKIAEMDNISKEWLDVIVQVSEVLTAEQREELEDMFDSHRGWGYGKRK